MTSQTRVIVEMIMSIIQFNIQSSIKETSRTIDLLKLKIFEGPVNYILSLAG